MTSDCPSTDSVLQSIDSHSDGFRDSECLEYIPSLSLIMGRREFAQSTLEAQAIGIPIIR